MKKAVVQKDVMNNVQKTLGEDQVISKIKKLFGNLKYVDPDYANKSRILLKGFISKFSIHANNIANNIEKDQHKRNDRMAVNLVNTLVWLRSFDDCDKFTSSKVHSWPGHAYFARFSKFRELIVNIERELDVRSLSDDPKVKSMFLKHDSRKLILLPTFDNGTHFNFANRMDLVKIIYDDIATMNAVVKHIIRNIVHPQYNWKVEFDYNSQNFYKLLSGSISQSLKEMQDVWTEQLPVLYLDSLGYDAGKFDWNILMGKLFNLDSEKQEALAIEGVNIISGGSIPGSKVNLKIREQANEVFGEKIVDALSREGQKVINEMKNHNRKNR